MDRYSNRHSQAFDMKYGTDTFVRSSLKEYEVGAEIEWDWLYGPINPDFFHEIIHRLPIKYERYSFLDVGAGKGLCMMLASDYPFQRLIAVEFAQELVEAGQRNISSFESVTGRKVNAEWICQDFMQYTPPQTPQLRLLSWSPYWQAYAASGFVG